jgi:hypothetical protein
MRGCAWWIAAGVPATMQMQQASSPVGREPSPAIANYRFRALKVPPGAPRNEPASCEAGVSPGSSKWQTRRLPKPFSK